MVHKRALGHVANAFRVNNKNKILWGYLIRYQEEFWRRPKYSSYLMDGIGNLTIYLKYEINLAKHEVKKRIWFSIVLGRMIAFMDEKKN